VKVVLVITGKGGSDGEGRGVLKRQVPMWLEGPELRSLVIGYDNAGIGHGGAGALYVRVRRGRNH
jgi:DNA-nicking Smr family endonuclease